MPKYNSKSTLILSNPSGLPFKDIQLIHRDAIKIAMEDYHTSPLTKKFITQAVKEALNVMDTRNATLVLGATGVSFISYSKHM